MLLQYPGHVREDDSVDVFIQERVYDATEYMVRGVYGHGSIAHIMEFDLRLKLTSFPGEGGHEYAIGVGFE